MTIPELAIQTTRIRHQQAPNPSGCRWCGTDPGNHGRRWIASRGMHKWQPPTRDQRLARMTARRNARADAELDRRLNALKEKP